MYPTREPETEADRRLAICKSLRIASLAGAHKIIVSGIKKGVTSLLNKGLNANTLTSLGYDSAGMKRLGCNESDLKALGYEAESDAKGQASAAGGEGPPQTLQQMVAAGWRASELRRHGFTLHHCKTAGCDARECERLGFALNELATEFELHELKRVGFGVNDLVAIFTLPELKSAGFTATDMRNASYTIRELLKVGYSENQVRAAGFSNRELVQEGLTRQTVDKTTLQKW